VPVSEGHACHAQLEGHVYRARGSEMDNPTSRSGRDKQVPPKAGPHKRVYQNAQLEGLRQTLPQEVRSFESHTLRSRQSLPLITERRTIRQEAGQLYKPGPA